MPDLQIEHNNRLYRDNNGCLEITHSDGRHFRNPSILYKYYSLNKNSVDAFTKHYLYAAHPLELNDRFDCSPYLISFESFKDELNLLKEINPRTKATEEELALDSLGGGYHEEIVRYYYEKLGIISLSKEMNNILMWSHYAKNDGFCVGFYVDKLPQWTGPFPIAYSKQRESTIVSMNQLSILPLLQCYQKNSKWKYEKEYRYLVDVRKKGTRKCEYPIDAIAEVYLGYSFFKQHEDNANDDGNFEVAIQNKNENDCLRTTILDFICKNHIQTNVDLTLYIDDVYFHPYYGVGGNGKYKFYW